MVDLTSDGYFSLMTDEGDIRDDLKLTEFCNPSTASEVIFISIFHVSYFSIERDYMYSKCLLMNNFFNTHAHYYLNGWEISIFFQFF